MVTEKASPGGTGRLLMWPPHSVKNSTISMQRAIVKTSSDGRTIICRQDAAARDPEEAVHSDMALYEWKALMVRRPETVATFPASLLACNLQPTNYSRLACRDYFCCLLSLFNLPQQQEKLTLKIALQPRSGTTASSSLAREQVIN